MGGRKKVTRGIGREYELGRAFLFFPTDLNSQHYMRRTFFLWRQLFVINLRFHSELNDA